MRTDSKDMCAVRVAIGDRWCGHFISSVGDYTASFMVYLCAVDYFNRHYLSRLDTPMPIYQDEMRYLHNFMTSLILISGDTYATYYRSIDEFHK